MNHKQLAELPLRWVYNDLWTVGRTAAGARVAGACAQIHKCTCATKNVGTLETTGHHLDIHEHPKSVERN